MEGHKMGLKPLILGLVVLANIYYLNWDWWLLIGWVLVVMGALKLIMKGSCKGKK